MIAMAAMIARPMPPLFNVGTSQVGMIPSSRAASPIGLPVLGATRAWFAGRASGRLGTFAVGLCVGAGRDLNRERDHFRLRNLRPARSEQIAQHLH
jgi:hypothetical protein